MMMTTKVGDHVFIIKDGSLMMAVSKGDSALFTVTFNGRIPEDGIPVLFTVKAKRDNSVMIQKNALANNGAVDIDLCSSDTNKLEYNVDYVWDIRVLYSESDVDTPMIPSPFVVLEVAGDV